MSTVYSVSNIRNIFREKLKNEDFVTDKTGVKTIEIINASFFGKWLQTQTVVSTLTMVGVSIHLRMVISSIKSLKNLNVTQTQDVVQ